MFTFNVLVWLPWVPDVNNKPIESIVDDLVFTISISELIRVYWALLLTWLALTLLQTYYGLGKSRDIKVDF